MSTSILLEARLKGNTTDWYVMLGADEQNDAAPYGKMNQLMWTMVAW